MSRLDYPISVLYIHTVRQSEPILRCWYVCEGRFHGGWDGPRMLNHTPNPPKVGSGCDKGPQNSLWQLCNFLFFFFPAKKFIWTHFGREPTRAVCARLWEAGCIPGRSDQNLAALHPNTRKRAQTLEILRCKVKVVGKFSVMLPLTIGKYFRRYAAIYASLLC